MCKPRGTTRGSCAEHVTDHHNARRDSDAYRKGLPVRMLERPDRRDDGECGTNGMLGRVLVGLRIAEVGQQSVAHEFRDVAVETNDAGRTGVLVAANQRACILRVQPVREFGGADQVAEQDGDLAPFGAGDISRERNRRSRGSRQRGGLTSADVERRGRSWDSQPPKCECSPWPRRNAADRAQRPSVVGIRRGRMENRPRFSSFETLRRRFAMSSGLADGRHLFRGSRASRRSL